MSNHPEQNGSTDLAGTYRSHVIQPRIGPALVVVHCCRRSRLRLLSSGVVSRSEVAGGRSIELATGEREGATV